MSTPDFQEVHDFLIAIAHKAGEMITSATPTTAGSGTKMNSADLVTETDKAVEKMVSTELRQKYPDFDFIGEETYQPNQRLSNAPTFIVDPIDGTTNFIHTFPYVSISLGLAFNRQPCVGVVYSPFTSTLYTAIKGKGSYVTSPSINRGKRTRLPLRSPPEPFPMEKGQALGKCLLAVEWGSDRSGNDFDVKVELFRRLAGSRENGGSMVHSLRSLGSAALNLCGVAAGQLDAYWECGCWAWDVCAGWVILEESGGRVVGAHPGIWRPALEGRRYFGVRAGEGWEGVVEELWGCLGEGRVEVGFDGVEGE